MNKLFIWTVASNFFTFGNEFWKSEITLVGELENVAKSVDEPGYKLDRLPPPYLGLPLSAHHRSKVVWDSRDDRFWKANQKM